MFFMKTTDQLGVSDEPVDSRATLYERTEKTETETSDLDVRVKSITVESKFVLVNAVATKVEALKLEKEVMEALNVTRGKVVNVHVDVVSYFVCRFG